MMDIQHCAGCEDDFYNGKNPLGVKECWNRKDAKREPLLIIGTWQNPPYKQKPVLMPTCYRQRGAVLVKPEAIGPDGYWKS